VPDVVVFGPESDRPSLDELLKVAFDSAVAVLQPQVDAAVRLSAALMPSFQSTIDALNQLVRAMAPVMEARSEQISAGHREYHRRQRARRRRR
jgi:hypothetical protein